LFFQAFVYFLSQGEILISRSKNPREGANYTYTKPPAQVNFSERGNGVKKDFFRAGWISAFFLLKNRPPAILDFAGFEDEIGGTVETA
jgi:hypothetical protein